MHIPGFTPDYLHFLSVMAGKVFFMFVYLVILFRLLGKRQTGQLNIYDLAAIMGVSNAVQNGMTLGSGNLSVGIVAVLVLLICGRVVTALIVRAPKLQQRLIGSPTLLISDGQMLEDNMRREQVTADEVLAALHEHGLQDPKEARMAVLEIDGSISIVPRGDGKQPPCEEVRLT